MEVEGAITTPDATGKLAQTLLHQSHLGWKLQVHQASQRQDGGVEIHR